MTLRVGFIGLGNQGGPIAAHYAPSGFETTVYDVDEAQMNALVEGGAQAASSPRQVAENADLIGICVPEDEHVRAVIALKEAGGHARRGRESGSRKSDVPESPTRVTATGKRQTLALALARALSIRSG